jgi:hypothetical protein
VGNNSLFQTFGCDGIPGTHKRGGAEEGHSMGDIHDSQTYKQHRFAIAAAL